MLIFKHPPLSIQISILIIQPRRIFRNMMRELRYANAPCTTFIKGIWKFAG